MKTKLSEPIPTAFPTCGEVFHYLIAALDLTAWADAFHDPSTKRREAAEIKALSDKLRDWATEADGRPPSRDELEEFIRQTVHGLPQAKELAFVLCSLWRRVLDEHVSEVRDNPTFLNRAGTRSWCARWRAPGTLSFLWALQKLLRRLTLTKSPMLDGPLDDLLVKAWSDTAGTDAPPKHPLHLICYQHYAKLRAEDISAVDARTVGAWRAGEDRPSCEALGRHFSQFPDKLGLLLNFAFAGLVEALANTMEAFIPPEDRPDCRRLLLDQARCMRWLDEALAEALAKTPDVSLADYERLLSECLGGYVEFLMELPRREIDLLDLRFARFGVYQQYEERIANSPVPSRFGPSSGRLIELWKGTALGAPILKPSTVAVELRNLRAEHLDSCPILAGLLFAIEARLVLCHEAPTPDSLQRAFNLYQTAFAESRYWAGVFTVGIAREALGLAALLHRREAGEGAIKPWIKKVFSWWDLLGLGTEFDHEQLDQRIELAESRFTDQLSHEVRARLKSALPELGLTHWNVGGLFGFTEEGLIEKLQATPVDRRQRKPMSKTIVGRDQTVLMEAIDRGQLELARELVRNGADLNFINSTGDTCVTKAFAREDYPLVLEILRRENDPIRRETLLRITNKKRISGLKQAISLGQVEILRELARWKNGRGEVIDMNQERIEDQTPLYYAVHHLIFLRMSPAEAFAQARSLMPKSVADSLQPEHFESLRKHLDGERNPEGVLRCIDLLINELHVEIDAPNIHDNTALTVAAEGRLHDVAAMLLAAQANVNHRFRGGGTALVRAILNDDYEMAKLLIEYLADYRLFVEALGRRIYLMPMSEKMRGLIPARA